MTDAFDRLERQLRQATREQAAPAPALGKPRRARAWRRGGLVVTLVALLGGGGAVAVAELAASPEQVQDGRHYAFQAVQRTAKSSACRQAQTSTGRLRLTDAVPLLALVRAVPGIASASPGEQAAVLQGVRGRVFSGGALLRSTLHLLRFTNGVTGAAYVQQGDGFSTLRDPAACAQARRDEARRLTADRSSVVQRETLARLAALRDTQQHLQTLVVATEFGDGGLGGTGTPLAPGQPFTGGLLASSAPAPTDPDQRGSYLGLADPRTVRIEVTPQHQRPGVPRLASRSGAFWSLLLPPRTGHVRLSERAADGTAVRTVRLR